MLMLASGLAMAAAQPAAAVATVEIDSATLQARGAAVELTYTVTCDPGGYFYFSSSVNQRSGNDLATGYGYGQATCTGAPEPVTVTVLATGAPFRPGAALVTTSTSYCDPWGYCEYATLQETIRFTQN
jgi:hypothetical protein